MKKSLLLPALFLFALTLQAQTDKKNVLINGQVSFNTRSTPYSSFTYGNSENIQTSFFFNPQFGYFISNNFVTGISLNLGTNNSLTKYENTIYTNNSNKSMQLGAGGFVRLYANISENFKFFTQGGMDYLRANSTISNTITPTSVKSSTDRLYMGASPGFVYFVRPKMGIEASFGELFYSKRLDTKSNSSSGVNLNLNSLRFGFSLYL